MQKILILAMMLALTTKPAFADTTAEQLAQIDTSYEQGNLESWLPHALQGNAEAQNNLGTLYKNGWGVIQDYAKVREWYEKAAARGNAAAQFNLGILYQYGKGVAQDYGKARDWYEKAAVQGDADAQIALLILPISYIFRSR